MLFAFAALCSSGCQLLSDRLTNWHMLGAEALEDPIQAVGGEGVVFAPPGQDTARSRKQLASADPQALVGYYAPVFVQQRSQHARPRPTPTRPSTTRSARPACGATRGRKLKAFVAGRPEVYAIYEKRKIGGHDHVQLTYTAWYPAHPRMKPIDLEEADIDSCVVRVTLDGDHAPLFYETIAACGCFHKVFVERWVEDAARKTYRRAGEGQEVRRRAHGEGRHRLGGGRRGGRDRATSRGGRSCSSRPATTRSSAWAAPPVCACPAGADVRPTSWPSIPSSTRCRWTAGQDKAPFFDMGKGGKVYGAERKERFIFSLIGVDDAGQPRANDQIKLHFDQSTWGDPTIYERFVCQTGLERLSQLNLRVAAFGRSFPALWRVRLQLNSRVAAFARTRVPRTLASAATAKFSGSRVRQNAGSPHSGACGYS